MPRTKWHCPNIWRRLSKNQLLSVMFNFCQLRILSTFILSSLFLSNRCPSTLLCQVGFCQTLRSPFVLESGSSNWNNAKHKFRSINWQGLWMRSGSQNYDLPFPLFQINAVQVELVSCPTRLSFYLRETVSISFSFFEVLLLFTIHLFILINYLSLLSTERRGTAMY